MARSGQQKPKVDRRPWQPGARVNEREPLFTTALGSAYADDAAALMSALPTGCANLVLTSPPYALHFAKEYGNVGKEAYVGWFLPFAHEIHRILAKDGSFVLNIGGSYNRGAPTRSLYHFKLLIALVEEAGFHLAQECFWHNPAKLPMPAEWVTVRRVRVRDSVEYVWWLAKGKHPKANNRHVLREYSRDMQRLHRNGVRPCLRPSGHTIRRSFDKVAPGGSIPPNLVSAAPENLLTFGNNASNDTYLRRCKELGMKVHPARFPAALPEFFIRLLTDPNDLVVDPFAGSNTTGAVAERLRRRWISADRVGDYLLAGAGRFGSGQSPDDREPQPAAQLALINDE
jgi:DNA modification methylase